MKKLLLGFALAGSFVFATAQTIAFDKTTLDYGTVKTGADGQRVFKVMNKGDKPLIISNVKASCGCTTPVWDKVNPIPPGKSGEIKVGYNTATNGDFRKMIEVFSNDPVNSRTALYIIGKVDPNAPEKKMTAAEKKKVEIDAKLKEISNMETGLEKAKASPESKKADIKTMKKSLKSLNKELKALNEEMTKLS